MSSMSDAPLTSLNEPRRVASNTSGAASRSRQHIVVAAYIAILAAAACIFLLVCTYGSTLPAPLNGASPVASVPSSTRPLLHVLAALATIMAVGRLLGACLRRMGQPAVIGEVLAGIALGPSLLGRVMPQAAQYVMPASAAPSLSAIAQLGIILYMCRVGLEFDTQLLDDRVHTPVAISHSSILVPFLLGSALALWLYPRMSTGEVTFTAFALFIGAAMSITAFPVLARILTEGGIANTPLGTIALTCAAVDDITGWCLLALVEGATRNRLHDAAQVIALAAGFMCAMQLVVRPLLARLLVADPDGTQEPTPDEMAIALGTVLLSALTTELIGIHAVFGAFVAGAIIPKRVALTRSIVRQVDGIVLSLLLPAYFAFTGMRTDIAVMSTGSAWLACLVIILVASLGKLGGTVMAARVCGMAWRPSVGLGVLMNTRGLMELIVLNIGLDLHVLSRDLFTLMVIMAVATTMATGPLMKWLNFVSIRPAVHRPTERGRAGWT